MSSRLKERGGGGGKIMASKAQKPLTSNSPKPKPSNRKTPVSSAASKENTTAARRNPTEVPAVRWSTSSIPSGKSPNPSDLKIRASETLDSKEFGSRVRVLGRCQQEKKGKDANLKHNLLRRSSLDVNLGKINGKDRNFGVDSRKSTVDMCNDKVNLNVNSKNSELKACNAKDRKHGPDSRVSEEIASKSTAEMCREKENLHANPKNHGMKSSDETNKENHGMKSSDETNKENAPKKHSSEVIKLSEISGSAKLEEKSSNCIRVSNNSSENGVQAINKYPSKLHEKLAALEGRVQRIASDIKRTKEMLDLNNSQAESKLILSDIQKKISGIESAVSCVMDGDGTESGLSDILRAENLTGRSSSKGLNLDELEARFFPHQKLIKNRTVLDGKLDLLKPKSSMSPIDENPIAAEFLASLNVDQQIQHDIKKDGRALKSELAGIKEIGREKTSSGANFESKKLTNLQCNGDIALMASEKLDDFDDQENKSSMMVFEEAEDSFKSQIFEIGCKSSTGGWFVSEGEAVLLAHNDSSCTYYDITNCEEKAVYMPPEGVSNNLWGDCWLIRAPGADGSSGRFVVAASAGGMLESGFCSWDFYTKNIQAFRVEDGTPSSLSSSRIPLAPLTNAVLLRRSSSCTMPPVESRQWWYRPCGPLLISTASGQKNVSAYDIRDGEIVLKWDVHSPVVGMEYSSPLQWRSRGKVIVAESETISLWDVNSLTPQPLLSVATTGKKINCLHVNNTDAEIGGGVRQRPRSSEVEGNDGVFCTQESINVFDFRLPSGVGLKIPRPGANNAHSIFSCGDSIFIGSSEMRSLLRNGPRSRVQQFSSRNGKLIATYALPDSNSHPHHASITQVWGNSNFVMGISGMGLHVFDALKEEPIQSFSNDRGNTVEVKETVGPDDMYHPTFDYLGSRVLVISRDRPAMWRYLL